MKVEFLQFSHRCDVCGNTAVFKNGQCLLFTLQKQQMKRTIAARYNLVAIILVLSNISLPGPEAKHFSLDVEHFSLSWSQTLPENSQRGPFVLGDTSPRLVDANAQTTDP